MNANAIAIGGSTAKQFDCGSGTTTNGVATVTFNITFTNIPHVVANATGVSLTNLVFGCHTTSVTTTGCTVYMTYFYSGAVNLAGNAFSWIAIG